MEHLSHALAARLQISAIGADVLKTKIPIDYDRDCGARDETRTRDPNLGKVMLYQLSYSRIILNLFWFSVKR
ncbi:MAG: hypothetical protein RL220_1619, partial [Bacteroidota bacterium]